MAWTAVRTWAVGEVVSAANMNTYISDNLDSLKGNAGTVTLGDGLDLGANEFTVNSVEIVTSAGALAVAHGASVHTDITREIFLPAYGYTTGTTSTVAGKYSTAECADAADQYITFTLKVPVDFVSFTKIEAVWGGLVASGNLRWKLYASYGASGEDWDNHVDEPAYGETATNGTNLLNIQEPANPLTLSSLATGDMLGVGFYREGTHANDTMNSNITVFGLIFTYTANQ
ncbi:MAG: hypothetical protein SVK08_00615 [Halobacteriota archaeon]|nr:hypothetical protein [Halobacteriota archaeon]